MFSSATGVLYSLVILGCLAVGSNAKFGIDRERYQKNAVSCYECSSEYDPRCGDPFDPYTIGIVNCSLKRHPNHIDPSLPPSLCRKLVQKIQGHTRILRGCGYITDARDDKTCLRRTGTHEVIVHYCACTGSLCNEAQQFHSQPFLRVVTLTLLPAIFGLLILA